jgi:hypothetical protein
MLVGRHAKYLDKFTGLKSALSLHRPRSNLGQHFHSNFPCGYNATSGKRVKNGIGTRMFPDNKIRRNPANIFGCKQFISAAVLKKSAAVYSRFMLKNSIADNRTIHRQNALRGFSHQPAQRVKPVQRYSALAPGRVPESHYDLFKRRIPGALAQAVDGNT